MKYTTLAAVLTVVTSLGISLPASAGPGLGFHPMKMAKMARALDLSENQRDQIDDLVNEARKSARPHLDALIDLRARFKALRAAEEFDEAAVRALVQEKAKSREELTVLKVRTMHNVKNLLTPTQQAEFLALQQRRKPGRRGRHGRSTERGGLDPTS